MSTFDEDLHARSAMQPDMWRDVSNVPVWLEWPVMREQFIRTIRSEFSRWIGHEQAHFAEQLLFAVGRFDEGAGLVRYFALSGWGVGTVLDIGAGNGGVAFALANCRANKVFTMDIVPNRMIRVLRQSLAVPLSPLVANGSRIPLLSNSIDLVILIDTIEHLPEPKEVGAEIMRVLRPGGSCMITTPARVRHLFTADPHYGIRGLALFPNEVQRFLVNKVFRRRIRDAEGRGADAYDVEHLYWHVEEIERLFPGPKRTEVLFNRIYRPPGRFTRAWIRHPTLVREWFLYAVRGFFYDKILIHKE